MSTLELLRNEIDAIDAELAELFVRRMEIVEKIAAKKKEEGLPTFDRAREDAILEWHSAAFERPDLLPYYQAFLEALLTLSKEYQKNLGGEHESDNQAK